MVGVGKVSANTCRWDHKVQDYPWAVWSTLADIHSTRCIDALFGVTGISGYL